MQTILEILERYLFACVLCAAIVVLLVMDCWRWLVRKRRKSIIESWRPPPLPNPVIEFLERENKRLEVQERRLRAEIRVLQQRLRDANRGAARSAKISWNLARDWSRCAAVIKKLGGEIPPPSGRDDQ